MDIALITGSAGLIGSEAVRFFSEKGFHTVGVDNDLRRFLFGNGASTSWNRQRLIEENSKYTHVDEDIRDQKAMECLFIEFGSDIKLIIHAAAQPSHDWAANDPCLDFTVNANGTLILLEMARRYCPKAVFIFTSTNKVYGDNPNRLPLI
jgi:CDP-paratose 2-epimerase